MSVQAWFSNDEVELDAGSPATLTLSIQNVGEATANYTIVPSGFTANWITLGRCNLTLFAGSIDTVEVSVTPPRLPTTSAGPTIIGVRVFSVDDPAAAENVETTLDIQPFDDRRIVALHPVARARRRSNFDFMVENHGNGLASCRLRLVDPSGRIGGTFDPPAVGVAPGGSSLVRFRAKAGGLVRRHLRTLNFEIEAEQPGHNPSASDFTLIQPPTISVGTIAKFVGVLALLGGLVATWFGAIKPAIEDATTIAVNEEVAGFQQTLDELGADINLAADATETTGTTPVALETEAGTPSFQRLSASPALAGTESDSFSIGEGQQFDLTDVRIENNNDDSGRASLAVNGDEIYVWSLDNVRGSLFEPRITPLRLQAGDNVTLTVRCDNVGSPVVGTCESAVNLSGRTLDSDG